VRPSSRAVAWTVIAVAIIAALAVGIVLGPFYLRVEHVAADPNAGSC
jgi:hypothetical protein